MTKGVIQKVVALMLVITAGYLLQRKFHDPTSTGALRHFIPSSCEATTIFVALPQASFSLWPLLHATKISSQNHPDSAAKRASSFDAEFATSLLAMSFPCALVVRLVIFSRQNFFNSPHYLGFIGGMLSAIGYMLLRWSGLHWMH